MILSVSNQVIAFLWTTVCGMAVAFVYDLFRIIRKAVKTGNMVTYVQDLLYWLITAIIMFMTIYYSNDGELRGFLFLGAFIGVILYGLLFSRIIMSSSLFIIGIVVRIVKLILFVVSYPIRMMIRLAGVAVVTFRRMWERGRAKKKH